MNIFEDDDDDEEDDDVDNVIFIIQLMIPILSVYTLIVVLLQR